MYSTYPASRSHCIEPVSQNANEVHQARLSLNDRIAMAITNLVGTMYACYLFAIIALTGLPGAVQQSAAQGNPGPFVAWLSSQFLQLVFLPLLMVGTNLLGRHSEVRAESDFAVNLKAELEVEQLHKKLDAIMSHLGIAAEAV